MVIIVGQRNHEPPLQDEVRNKKSLRNIGVITIRYTTPRQEKEATWRRGTQWPRKRLKAN